MQTMLPIPHSYFIKRNGINKRGIKKITKKADKKIKVLFDTVHIFRGSLKIFCTFKKRNELISVRIPIPQNLT